MVSLVERIVVIQDDAQNNSGPKIVQDAVNLIGRGSYTTGWGVRDLSPWWSRFFSDGANVGNCLLHFRGVYITIANDYKNYKFIAVNARERMMSSDRQKLLQDKLVNHSNPEAKEHEERFNEWLHQHDLSEPDVGLHILDQYRHYLLEELGLDFSQTVENMLTVTTKYRDLFEEKIRRFYVARSLHDDDPRLAESIVFDQLPGEVRKRIQGPPFGRGKGRALCRTIRADAGKP